MSCSQIKKKVRSLHFYKFWHIWKLQLLPFWLGFYIKKQLNLFQNCDYDLLLQHDRSRSAHRTHCANLYFIDASEFNVFTITWARSTFGATPNAVSSDWLLPIYLHMYEHELIARWLPCTCGFSTTVWLNGDCLVTPVLPPAGREYEGYQPLWFHQRRDSVTGETNFVYKGGYWESKEKQDWSMCPDIF